MRRAVRWVGVVLLLGLLVIAAGGCAAPPPKKFNNMMGRANQRMATAAKSFSKAVHEKPPNVAAARGAFTEMETALRETRKEFDGLSAPHNSPPGDTLLTKYREFLDIQQSILDRNIRPAWEKLQRPGANLAEIEGMLQQAGQRDRAALGELKKAQDAFCKHHAFEPKAR